MTRGGLDAGTDGHEQERDSEAGRIESGGGRYG
jgi:hypothetical protein